jgi:hypothetical protein
MKVYRATKRDGIPPSPMAELVLLVTKHADGGMEHHNLMNLIDELVAVYGTPQRAIQAIEMGEVKSKTHDQIQKAGCENGTDCSGAKTPLSKIRSRVRKRHC